MLPKKLAPCAWMLAAVALAGCGPGEEDPPIPEQATDCPTQFGQDFTETRKVDVGDASSGDLVPYAEGGDVELILGNQGSMMITPWVRVEATAEDGDEACHVVRLDNEFESTTLEDDPDAVKTNQFNVHFVRDGDVMISDGALYHPFAWDRATLEGEKLKLTVTVRGDGFEGTKAVGIVLK